MMKKIGLCLLAAVMAVSAASCGGGGRGDLTSDVDLSVEDPTTLSGSIKVALPSTGNKRAILEEAVAAYEEARPNVEVSVEWKAEDNFYNSYKIDVSGGLIFPDAAFIDHVYVQNLASLDLVADVSSVLGDREAEDFPYIQNLVDANVLDGKVYGFPFNANSVALFYNKELMGDHEVPTTYEEFKTVAAALVQENPALKNKVFSLSTGVDYRNFGAMMFISWLGRNGGQILSDDLRNSNFNSDEVKTTLEQWKEIIDNEWASAALSNEGNFYNGEVAMLEMGCWKVYDLLESESNLGKYGVTNLFTLKDGVEAQSIIGLYSMCLRDQAERYQQNEDCGGFLEVHLYAYGDADRLCEGGEIAACYGRGRQRFLFPERKLETVHGCAVYGGEAARFGGISHDRNGNRQYVYESGDGIGYDRRSNEQRPQGSSGDVGRIV